MSPSVYPGLPKGHIRRFGRPDSPAILGNVARLHAELRTLFPALEASYENPPFSVLHKHGGITRGFLTDFVPDITTLALEDRDQFYLIVSDNSGTIENVELSMKLPRMQGVEARPATVLNEAWSRTLAFSEDTGEWSLDKHAMCFGDINVWVIPKARPAQ